MSALFVLASSSPATASPACTINGTSSADTLRGTSGADVICGRGGNDYLVGGAGPDRLSGGPGDDELIGGPGLDLLLGGKGDDLLKGGKGNDTLLGGPGGDSCAGSASQDVSKSCNDFGSSPSGGPQPPQVNPPSSCSLIPGGCADTGPVLAWFSTSPGYIDTSQGDAPIQFYVDATSWGSAIESFELTVSGPQGLWRNVTIGEADRQGFGFMHEETLPAGSAPGTYTVTSLTITDELGNQTVIDDAELEAENYARSVEVIDQPDTVGPALGGFTFSPDNLDTSTGPGSVNLSVRATDALSGVKQVSVHWNYPNTVTRYSWGSTRTSGNIHDGFWTGEVPLPRWAAPGSYVVNEIHLYDQAGNHTTYSRSQLTGMGFADAFTQDGAGDTTDPVILDLTHNPDTIHTAQGQRVVTFTAHVSDDLSGIGASDSRYPDGIDVSLDFPGSPSSHTYGGTLATRVSGSDTNGLWTFTVRLPVDAPTGTYTVGSVRASDRAANQTALSGAPLNSSGWDLTFENLP